MNHLLMTIGGAIFAIGALTKPKNENKLSESEPKTEPQEPEKEDPNEPENITENSAESGDSDSV